MSLQSQYLTCFPAGQLPTLLKHALTPGLLAAMLSTLLTHTLFSAPDNALAMLNAMHAVPRFDMNLLSLSSKGKGELKAAWDSAEQQQRGDILEQLRLIRQKYKL